MPHRHTCAARRGLTHDPALRMEPDRAGCGWVADDGEEARQQRDTQIDWDAGGPVDVACQLEDVVVVHTGKPRKRKVGVRIGEDLRCNVYQKIRGSFCGK